MILVDANLLVYAGVTSLPHSERARVWLDEQLNGATRVGLPWPSILGFVRLVSNPRIFERPVDVQAAWRQVERWLDCPAVWVPQPTSRHREVMGDLIPACGGRSSLVPDAHIAALAIEHCLLLCSADRDLARFPGLRWCNPLQD